jgi:hypothetical protein
MTMQTDDDDDDAVVKDERARKEMAAKRDVIQSLVCLPSTSTSTSSSSAPARGGSIAGSLDRYTT